MLQKQHRYRTKGGGKKSKKKQQLHKITQRMEQERRRDKGEYIAQIAHISSIGTSPNGNAISKYSPLQFPVLWINPPQDFPFIDYKKKWSYSWNRRKWKQKLSKRKKSQ